MTDVLTDAEPKAAVRTDSPSARVLGVLSDISEGRDDAIRRMSSVYADVKALIDRLSGLNGLGAEMNIQPSPYLVHINKMRKIEE